MTKSQLIKGALDVDTEISSQYSYDSYQPHLRCHWRLCPQKKWKGGKNYVSVSTIIHLSKKKEKMEQKLSETLSRQRLKSRLSKENQDVTVVVITMSVVLIDMVFELGRLADFGKCLVDMK